MFVSLIFFFFFFIQTPAGQTEALIKKDTAEKTGDYTHGCSFKTCRGVLRDVFVVFVDYLRQSHICLPLLRTPLHAEAHQQQSQGSHPFRR